jgi:hypothetical protein
MACPCITPLTRRPRNRVGAMRMAVVRVTCVQCGGTSLKLRGPTHPVTFTTATCERCRAHYIVRDDGTLALLQSGNRKH